MKTLILTWFAKYTNDIAACTLTKSAAVYRKSFACQIPPRPPPPQFRLLFFISGLILQCNVITTEMFSYKKLLKNVF